MQQETFAELEWEACRRLDNRQALAHHREEISFSESPNHEKRDGRDEGETDRQGG